MFKGAPLTILAVMFAFVFGTPKALAQDVAAPISARASLQAQIAQLDQQLEAMRQRTVAGRDEAIMLKSSMRMRLLIRDLFITAVERDDDIGARAGVCAWNLMPSLRQFDELFNEMPDLVAFTRNQKTPPDDLKIKHGRMFPLLDSFAQDPARKIPLDEVKSLEALDALLLRELSPLVRLMPHVGRPAVQSAWLTPAGNSDTVPMQRQIDQLELLFKLRLSGYPGHRQVLDVLKFLRMGLAIEDFRPQVEPIFRQMEQVTQLLIELRRHEDLNQEATRIILSVMEVTLRQYMNAARRAEAQVQVDRILFLLDPVIALNRLHDATGPTIVLQDPFKRAVELLFEPQNEMLGRRMLTWLAAAARAMQAYRQVERPRPGPLRSAYFAALTACGQAERQLIEMAGQLVKEPSRLTDAAGDTVGLLMRKRSADVVRIGGLDETIRIARTVEPSQLRELDNQFQLLMTELGGADRVAASVVLAELDDQVKRYKSILIPSKERQLPAIGDKLLVQQHRAWVKAWSQRQPDAARQAMEPLLRVGQIDREISALPNGEELLLINRWAGVWIEPDILTEAINLMRQRFGEIQHLLAEDDISPLRDALALFESDFAHVLALAHAYEQFGAHLSKLPDGISNTLGQVVYRPAFRSVYGNKVAALSRLSLLFNELDQQSVMSDPAAKRRVMDWLRVWGTELRPADSRAEVEGP